MWTTDTFLQNLVRFSVLKGQGQDRPTAVGTDPRPSGRTHGRRDGPTAVGTDTQLLGRTHGRRDGPTAVGMDTELLGPSLNADLYVNVLSGHLSLVDKLSGPSRPPL